MKSKENLIASHCFFDEKTLNRFYEDNLFLKMSTESEELKHWLEMKTFPSISLIIVGVEFAVIIRF